MTVQEFPIEYQNEDVSEADLAALRWRAIEAANSAPGLSPMARRVMIAMICTMDGKTRECYPSELWLSTFLGVNLVSVKRAKVELRDEHYLVTWENPGGPRHQSRYMFNWQKIIRYSDTAKSVARNAVNERRSTKSAYGSRQTTYQGQIKGSHQTTNEVRNDDPKVAVSLSQGSQTVSQGSRVTTSKVAARLPDQPFILPSRTTLLDHASSGAAQYGRAPEALVESVSTPRPAEAKVALEEGASPGLKIFPYPKLLEAFHDLPDVKSALPRLDAARLCEASRLLAMKGKAAAADYVARSVA